MKYPAYPKYKDSGVEWLGEVPKHWGVGKLGFEASVKARLGWKGLKAEEYVDEGYVFLSTPNIKGNCIDFDNVNYITEERYFESPEIMICQGDVLIAKDGSTTGITNVVRHLPSPATVNSSLAVLRPNDGTDSVYLYYWMLSSFTQFMIKKMQGGMGVPHLFQADLKKFSLLLPSLPEQRAIAAFLDAQTSKIDILIAKKRELIDKLKEKRAALITRAVTRGLPPEAAKAAGLDPHPEMKDSGVEWLGEVPEHWMIVPLKWHARCFSGEYINNEEVVRNKTEESPTPVIGGNGIMGYLDRSNIADDTIAIGRVGALCGNVHMVSAPAWITDNALVLNFQREAFAPSFLCLVLIIRNLNEIAARTAQPLITGSQVKDQRIPCPPLPEQRAIADYLDRETSAIDTLVSKVATAIERLQEYRSALITAAVTGKIDVREAVQ